MHSPEDIPACADYIKGLGFRDVKVNYPITAEDSGDITPATLDGIVEWVGAWQQALGRDCAIALDVAFAFKMVGIRKLARALEPFNMLWLEAETLDPLALKSVRESTSTPSCWRPPTASTRNRSRARPRPASTCFAKSRSR